MTDIQIIDLLLNHKDTEEELNTNHVEIIITHKNIINKELRELLDSFERSWYYMPSSNVICISRTSK